MSAIVLLFARYGERYVSVSRAFAAYTINFILATTFTILYSRAISLISFKFILFKLMKHKEMTLSIACENMVHRHKVLMGVPLTGNIVVTWQLFNQ